MATRCSRFMVPAVDSPQATSSTSTPRSRCGTTRRARALSSIRSRVHPATKTHRCLSHPRRGAALLRPYTEVPNALRCSYCTQMRRALISGGVLLLCGAVAARGKTESLLFVFLRVDHEHDNAILRPMIAPDIGVQLDSGPPQLTPGTVLACEMVA